MEVLLALAEAKISILNQFSVPEPNSSSFQLHWNLSESNLSVYENTSPIPGGFLAVMNICE